ncbi:LPS export ABC transporter periplasmic protein LptC [Sulfurimonas crateris]|uniref:LPS export ABC transporter periplasmic protein LptC n=1 Tax=Sulfurimonas crateris TaxID=2574727 RepID=A0A4U2Z6K4_9BACT|nr:LPS export ABC transporter periplasmic protein LptC [Sulfurimonas crateris]TKI69848.1 LPS export ABC transporter periplasmic protein LptC [Sulfurimonas crateris]
MNINYFFIFFSLCLLMILFLFKPMEIKQHAYKEVPLFTISTFTMHELDKNGLVTLMNGSEASRFTNRYTVKDMDYTDNSKEYMANMKANSGVYKNEIVDLVGDILYVREDGLTFETQKALYNKKTAIATANGKFVLYRDANRVTGVKLKYNDSLERVEAKNVYAIYKLEERKR